MPATLSVSEMFGAFGSGYRAIDARVAAYVAGDAWLCAFATVRLSPEEPERVAQRHEQLRQTWRPAGYARFQIALHAVPIMEWEQFCSNCAEGFLIFGGSHIQLREKVALKRMEQYIHRRSSEFCGGWPGMIVTSGQLPIGPLSGGSIVRNLEAAGWPSPYHVINALCETNVSNGNCSFELMLGLPALARIQSVAVNATGEVAVTVRRRRAFPGFSIAVSATAQGSYFSPKEHRVIELSETAADADTESEDLTVAQVMQLSEHDQLEVRLVHQATGEIDSSSSRVRELVPAAQHNALHAVLQRFCTDATLDDALLRPHNHKARKSSHKEASAFELHVSWLLGLLGLPCIVLSSYERLKATETLVQIASVDLIALHTQASMVLLIACTVGPVREQDLSNIATAAATIQREALGHTSFRAVPVIITGGAKGSAHSTSQAVKVLDASDLQILLTMVSERREDELLSVLEGAIPTETIVNRPMEDD